MKLNKFKAVTQSQTLAIMGIVGLILFAMIAVPLYKACKQKETVSKLKVIHSSIIQANKMYSLATSESIEDIVVGDDSPETFANKYFVPYMKNKGTCSDSQDKCWKILQYVDLAGNKYFDKINYSIILSSGAVLGFYKDENGLMHIIADINGKSGENMLGKDVFVFSFFENNKNTKLCDKSEYAKRYLKDGMHFGGYDKCGIPFDAYTFEELSSKDVNDACNKKALKSDTGLGVGSACLARIYLANWAIDKKYPW